MPDIDYRQLVETWKRDTSRKQWRRHFFVIRDDDTGDYHALITYETNWFWNRSTFTFKVHDFPSHEDVYYQLALAVGLVRPGDRS